VFFVQVFTLVICVVAGMSESYPWLVWGQCLVLVADLLTLVNLFFPLVILVIGLTEKVSFELLLLAVLLSVVMTVASHVALFPVY
jgi:hypothetical protein